MSRRSSSDGNVAPEVSGTLAPEVRRHLRFGWVMLLIYLMLGAALEALHGFKVAAYLNVSNETRRLLWTLAHAHGSLLAVINIVFAFTLVLLKSWAGPGRTFASRALIAATILLPAGFFLGGIVIYAGDPGLGILLVPVGAVLLFLGVGITALAVAKRS